MRNEMEKCAGATTFVYIISHMVTHSYLIYQHLIIYVNTILYLKLKVRFTMTFTFSLFLQTHSQVPIKETTMMSYLLGFHFSMIMHVRHYAMCVIYSFNSINLSKIMEFNVFMVCERLFLIFTVCKAWNIIF